MAANTAISAVHPAQARLRDATLAERCLLARALAIEADWRYHDGPEWAARYWAAFGDLHTGAGNRGKEDASTLAARNTWPVLAESASNQARAIFRALLVALHPQVLPQASCDDRAQLWPHVLRAYGSGDLSALRNLLGRVRALGIGAGLPQDIVALRREHDRLVSARQAVDRRLAELSQTFPFSLRDKLDDADWIRRQRLALRQIRVLTAPSQAARDRHKTQREQVS